MIWGDLEKALYKSLEAFLDTYTHTCIYACTFASSSAPGNAILARLSVGNIVAAIFTYSINQSVQNVYSALQDIYSEALPTQAKRKRTVLRRWWN